MKLTEIWDSGLSVICMWGTCDLLVFKFIMRSSSACLKMACNLKTAGHRGKQGEIWELGEVGYLGRVSLTFL